MYGLICYLYINSNRWSVISWQLWVRLVHVFKNWKLLFENIYENTCEWKSVLKCVKCCLKTEKCCLKIQTKHPLSHKSQYLSIFCQQYRSTQQSWLGQLVGTTYFSTFFWIGYFSTFLNEVVWKKNCTKKKNEVLTFKAVVVHGWVYNIS